MWLSIVSTSTMTILLATGVVWLCKNWIISRLTSSIQHEYNERLEELRAEIRSSETEIAILRNGAISNLTSHQTAVAQRRIQAVDLVWSTAVEGEKFRHLTKLIEILNLGEIEKASPEERARAKPFFESFTKNLPDIATIDGQAASVRPYISSLAWAYFRAYRLIIGNAFATLKVLEVGENPSRLVTQSRRVRC